MQLLSYFKHSFLVSGKTIIWKTGKTDIFPEYRIFSEIDGFSSDSETDVFNEFSDIENLQKLFSRRSQRNL